MIRLIHDSKLVHTDTDSDTDSDIYDILYHSYSPASGYSIGYR